MDKERKEPKFIMDSFCMNEYAWRRRRQTPVAVRIFSQGGSAPIEAATPDALCATSD